MWGLAIKTGIRHPLFASWKTTPAAKAAGACITIAGTLDELAEAAARGASASHAIFTLHATEGPFLNGLERETLWQLFQVPHYTMIVDPKGRIVAYECEAKDGLHLAEWTPTAGTIASSPCECGRPGPRWIPAPKTAFSAA